MKVLLKSVPELISEGWEFSGSGHLCSKVNCSDATLIHPNHLFRLGSVVELSNLWVESIIKKEVKSKMVKAYCYKSESGRFSWDDWEHERGNWERYPKGDTEVEIYE